MHTSLYVSQELLLRFIIFFMLLQGVPTIPATKESKVFDACIAPIAPAIFEENEKSKDVVQGNTEIKKIDLNVKT